MGLFHFFKSKRKKEPTKPTKTHEQRFALLYHHLMVLKANETDNGFPSDDLIKKSNDEIETLKYSLVKEINTKLQLQQNLSTLQDQADELVNDSSVFTRQN